MGTFGGNPNPFDKVTGANGERLFTEKLEEHHDEFVTIFRSRIA
jgi:hypothetical protein